MAEAGHAPAEADMMGGSKYKQIMGIRAVHYLACWALIYVGVEVTLGGKHIVKQPKLAAFNAHVSRVDRHIHRTEAWR